MSAAPPALSVVVAASTGGDLLLRSLESFADQTGVDEVVVAANVPVDLAGHRLGADARVRVVACAPGTTVPMLRARGLEAATGDVVALTEDNVVAGAGWAGALRAAFRDGAEVAGGPVDPDEAASPHDWAVYFYEYGRFMSPVAPGPTDRLAGNNVAYARPVLDRLGDRAADGFYEAFLHDALRAEGVDLVMAPEAGVRHVKTYDPRETVRQCYHHGRGYAAMRVDGAPGLRRAGWGAAALALPVVLPGRIVLQTLRKGRHGGPLAAALPRLVGLMTAWAVGEATGYVAGPGRSLHAWT